MRLIFTKVEKTLKYVRKNQVFQNEENKYFIIAIKIIFKQRIPYACLKKATELLQLCKKWDHIST